MLRGHMLTALRKGVSANAFYRLNRVSHYDCAKEHSKIGGNLKDLIVS